MDRIGNDEKEKAGKEDSRRTMPSALSCLRAFLTGAVMALAWGALSYMLGLNKLFPDQAQIQMFARPIPIQIVLYGIVSPLLEELLFRKFLYDVIVRFIPWKAAAVLVSVLFALWHGNMIQMLYAFPAGIILQEMRRRSGRMEEPVCCHAGANLTSILVEGILAAI